MRIASRLLAVLLLCLCLSGCWGRLEVNDIAIVTATGVDLTEEGRIRLSLLLAIPRLIGTGTAQGGAETKLAASAGWVVSADGDTIMDTYRNLQMKLPRRIFFSHSSVIVIGRKLADRDIVPVLDFFERYRQSQLKSYIAVSRKTAAEILNFQPKFEKLPSEVLKEELKQELVPSIRLIDFLNSVASEGEEPFAPMLDLMPSQPESKNRMMNVAVVGIAAFNSGRMVGQLDDKLSRGVVWVRNLVSEGVVTVRVPEDQGGGMVTAELQNVRVRRRPSFREGKVEMRLDIRVTQTIYENTSRLDLSVPSNMALVSELMEADIKRRIEDAAAKVQTVFKSDIFGYGQTIYRLHPGAWHRTYRDRWPELFPETATVASVHVDIVRVGLTSRTIKPEE